MNLRERTLYHQIHPLKLATDWGTAGAAAALLWQHRLGLALLVGVVPSMVASFVLIQAVDLTRWRDSTMGRYLAKWMTHRIEALRFGGLAICWGGAWTHRPAALAIGLAVILGAWLGGIFVCGRSAAHRRAGFDGGGDVNRRS